MAAAAGRDLVFHPAGPDAALRAALEDLQAGRWMAMRALLAETGTDWAVRTARTQVLGAAAARSNVLGAWRAEEPGSADLGVMQARVSVEHALLAHRKQDRNEAAITQRAREACWAAGRRLPNDPVPWVCLLALAQADERQQRPEHYLPAPEPMLSPGPWGLLGEADHRDPFNREAFHRMLRFSLARAAGSPGEAVDFARYVGSVAPEGSPLLVLPLYAYVERYREMRDSGRLSPLLRGQWAADHVRHHADRALHGWFEQPATGPRAPLDLNHLAHALWAGDRFEAAHRVFSQIGPYATHLPWAHVADSPEQAEEEFRWARNQCRLAGPDARGRPGHKF
jgi:hypothetical protein